MNWKVIFTEKAWKQAKMLNDRVLAVLQLLVEDLKIHGPAPGMCWNNYGKLIANKRKDMRHCHLIKGKPTYVCCWRVNKLNKIIEVYYVGTHEKAPY